MPFSPELLEAFGLPPEQGGGALPIDPPPYFGPLPDFDPMPILDIGGVPCVMDLRDNDVINEQVTPLGPQAVVQLKCFWRDRWKLVKALMGQNYLKNNNTITRRNPFEYPSRNNLFCTAIPNISGIKPYRDDSGIFSGYTGWMAYRYAIVTAVFSKPSYQVVLQDAPEDNDLSNKTFVTTTLKPSGQTLSPPGGTYYFIEGVDKGQPIKDANLGLIFIQIEITMRRHLMPVVPIWDINECIGRTNQTDFKLTNGNFAPGLVLFAGIDLDPKADPSTGLVLWDIDYKFLGHTAGGNTWNTALDRAGEWSRINSVPNPDSAGAGRVPFPETNFDRLMSDTIATGPDADPGDDPV